MHSVLFFLILLFSFTSSFAQRNWELVEEKDGIQVYIKDNPISDFKAFKGIITLNTDFESIHQILTDHSIHHEVFPNNAGAKLIDEKEGEFQIYYSLVDSPWPVDDRDGVYKTVFDFQENTRRYYIEAIDGYVEEKPDVVRISETRSEWVLTKMEDGMIKIEYEVFSDPGGSVPSWLANAAIVDQPIETLSAIRERLKQ